MSRLIIGFLTAIFLIPLSVQAQQTLSEATITNCGPSACSRIVTREISRSSLKLSMLAFESARLEIVTPDPSHKIIQAYEAKDGYFDFEDQVIVLRGLKNSKHSELIYTLEDNKLMFF